ncbi:MAG: molybdenum cofactor guanylyltransferase [Thermoplasmata archaeon]
MASVSGLVLAGGEGSRVGAFKALLSLGGQPLIIRPVEVLRAVSDEVLVAYGSREHGARLDRVVEDARLVGDEGLGPLGGLDRGAQAAQGEWLLVAPCDVPFLSPDLYRVLLRRAQRLDGCILRRGDQDNLLIAAYRRNALLQASALALGKGERAAQALLPHLRLARLGEADLRGLPYGLQSTLDIDTLEDLARAEGLLQEGPKTSD